MKADGVGFVGGHGEMHADGVDFKEAQAPKTDGMTGTDTNTGDYQDILHVL